ncbi:MAG TPA: hypothetical protein IAB58_04040 [Candidatus Pelethosoma merdigallinarum]|nr:hypothetical protein [Candidatus Pelethosoma merdigallinarum]
MRQSNLLQELFLPFTLFLISIIAIVILFYFFFLQKFNSKKSFQVKIYGLFGKLNNKSILAISIWSIKNIFLLYLLIFSKYDAKEILWILIILDTMMFLTIHKPSWFVFDLSNSAIFYLANSLCYALSQFLVEVRDEWYVKTILILLIVFLIIYCIYVYLRRILQIIVLQKNKKGGRRNEKEKVKKMAIYHH